MTAVEASDLPALHAFVRGLRKDLDAVVAGLSLPYSNGPIEGTNTKFKLLKRQMYGRAGFALLRQRILLSCLRFSTDARGALYLLSRADGKSGG